MRPGRFTEPDTIRTTLIAPCGMNCRLCIAYVREKNICPGCRGDDSVKSKSCLHCRIKNCELIVRGKVRYCFSCTSFPCQRLKHLDRRYRTKYGMSMLENLQSIRDVGVRRFVKEERAKWTCPGCGELLCVHKPHCLVCEHRWRQDRRPNKPPRLSHTSITSPVKGTA